jgi:hypothetical protein
LTFRDKAGAIDESVVSADELCDVNGRKFTEIAFVH